YAGSGIAGSNPLKTGVTALRLAIAGFLIPFVFVLEPSLLLEGSVSELIPALVTVILGMVAIAAGLAGYFFMPSARLEKAVLIIGGGMMVYPSIGGSVVGIGLAVAVAVIQLLRRGRTPSDRDEAPVAA